MPAGSIPAAELPEEGCASKPATVQHRARGRCKAATAGRGGAGRHAWAKRTSSASTALARAAADSASARCAARASASARCSATASLRAAGSLRVKARLR